MAFAKAVQLDSSVISPLIKEHKASLEQIPDIDFELDLTKEFRYRNYPVIMVLLKNPLKEYISTVPPCPEKDYKDTKRNGFLYLYDGKVPGYMNDNIKWRKTRMSVKLIVFNKNKGIFKLKNHKSDEGNSVMRRQTWQGNGWRKNEYKLINRETYYKPEADGSFSISECQNLQDFPVLVHYFRKNDNINDSENDNNNSFVAEIKPNPIQKKRKMEPVVSTPLPPILNDEPFILSTLPSSPNPPFVLSPVISSPPLESIHLSKDELSIFSTDFSPLSPPTLSMPIMGSGTIPSRVFQNRVASIPIATPPPSAEVKSYAPDTSPAFESTKILMVVDGFPKDKDAIFTCMFETNEITATVKFSRKNLLIEKQIAPNTFEVKSPAHEAGMIHFWMSCKIGGDKKNVFYSNVMTLYVTPCDDTGRLNLAFRNLTSDLKSKEMMSKFRHTVRELDLSNNQLSDVDFLSDFHELHTLILDNNQISSNSVFPHLPKLIALYVNCNVISELETFIEKLKMSFPSIQYLSMLGNDACPVFNRAPHIYYNYRIFVISKLRKLTQLDSSPVTPEEWRHASSLVTEEDLVIKKESNYSLTL